MKDVFQNYLFDLGYLLKSEAISATAERDSKSLPERPFYEGLALGYINVLSLMLNQAKTFGMDPADLHLDGFDPDQLH
jgi:hypothetical protein